MSIAQFNGIVVFQWTGLCLLPLVALWGIFAHPRINEQALSLIQPSEKPSMRASFKKSAGLGPRAQVSSYGNCGNGPETVPASSMNRHPVVHGSRYDYFEDHVGKTIHKWAANGPDMISLVAIVGHNEFNYAHISAPGKPLFGALMSEVIKSHQSNIYRSYTPYDMSIAHAWASHQVADAVSDAPDGYSNTKRTLKYLPANNPWVKVANHGLAEFGVDAIMFYQHQVDYEKDGAAPVYWNPYLMQETSLLWILQVDPDVKLIESRIGDEMGYAWTKVIAALRWVITSLPEETRESMLQLYSDYNSPSYPSGNQYEKSVKAVVEFLAPPTTPDMSFLDRQVTSSYLGHTMKDTRDKMPSTSNLCYEFALDLSKEIERRGGWKEVPWLDPSWKHFFFHRHAYNYENGTTESIQDLLCRLIPRFFYGPLIGRLPKGAHFLPRILPKAATVALTDTIQQWKAPSSSPDKKIVGTFFNRLLRSPGVSWADAVKDTEMSISEILKP